MSWEKLARNLLWLLVVALVAAGITLVVSISRERGSGERAATVFDPYGCLTCHGDPSYQPQSTDRPWEELYVEGEVLAASAHRSVQCTGCHLTFDSGQPIDRAAAQELCGLCHGQELALQRASVHSDPEVVACVDCHSPSRTGHDIPALASAASPAHGRNVIETCGGCHSDERLMARYGLNTEVHQSYLDSPHGKVVKLTGLDLGGLNPATCTSCHGSHDVLAVDDPTSPLRSAAGLARVCATCHRGANESFARTVGGHEKHGSDEKPGPTFYGERFFFLLTASVVGLGILMVGLEGFGWLRGQSKGDEPGDDDPPKSPPPGDEPPNNPGDGGRGAGSIGMASALLAVGTIPTRVLPRPRPRRAPTRGPAAPQEIVRFDIHQRVQHLLMMTSFLILALTGLPQKFPDWAISQWLIGLWGGLDTARTIHRFFGLVMIADCFYHLGYVGYSTLVLKRPFPLWMIPTPKDLADFFQDLQCWFGRSRERPQFDRFSYREKFDYWAIFWGMPVMGISGLILMFPVLAARFLPADAIAVAFIAHSDEAVLAVLWIFIVHFFFVHLNPRFFPLNRAIFTGRMPRHIYLEEHPRELAALEAGRTEHTSAGRRRDERQTRNR